MKARDELLDIIRRQHDAIDTLFAMLIEETRSGRLHARSEPFMPSKSGDVWHAAKAGAEALAQDKRDMARQRTVGEHTLDKLRDALIHCGEQACGGLQHEHGDCPATFACSAIVGELIDLGMTPDGVEEVKT